MRHQVNQKTKSIKKRKFILVLLTGLTFNQVFAAFEIKKHSINSGGSETISATYKLKGSFGQVEANNTQSGGSYSLNAGFWNSNDVTPTDEMIFTNGFE